MKKIFILFICVLLIFNVVGCTKDVVQENVDTGTNNEKEELNESQSQNENLNENNYKNLYPEFIVDETETSVTYIDKFGKETIATKNPEKVVVLFNSVLGLWYYTGGESLTKVKGKTNVPEEALDNIDLGSAYSVSLEAILALEPSLVLMVPNSEIQVQMAPSLNEMGIETMMVDTSINSYECFKKNAYLFSKILGTEDSYDEKINPIVDEINDIIAKTKEIEEKPKVAVIFTTSKNMSLESDIALVGEMVYLLGGENIMKKEDILAEGETRVSFSIEALITQDPDIIMFSTMGKVEAAKENIDKMITENPAWEEVSAVRNNRVHFLPKEFSVYKPNQRYNEAFKSIAKILYPEHFSAE